MGKVCSYCGQDTGSEYYNYSEVALCKKHREIWVFLMGGKMPYEIDMDVYKDWLDGKNVTIQSMKTKEEVDLRIEELRKIEFFTQREWALLHQQRDKLTGRNGIPPYMKEKRDALITDPHIKVNWDGDPRRKVSKPKENKLGDLLGIGNIKDEMNKIKAEAKAKAKGKDKEETGPLDMSVINMLVAENNPKAEPVKLTEDEAKARADAFKEKIRLAKEGKK